MTGLAERHTLRTTPTVRRALAERLPKAVATGPRTSSSPGRFWRLLTGWGSG